MATINSRETVDQIIEGNGIYPGDSIRVVRIVQYNNIFNGGVAYGLIYQGEDLNRYHSREAATINPTVIWDYDDHSKSEKVDARA